MNTEPLVSFSLLVHAMLALCAIGILAVVIAYLVVAARYTYLGWRLEQASGSYRNAVRVVNAEEMLHKAAESLYRSGAVAGKPNLRLVKR